MDTKRDPTFGEGAPLSRPNTCVPHKAQKKRVKDSEERNAFGSPATISKSFSGALNQASADEPVKRLQVEQ
jgi:hypothetical protein